MLRIITRTEPSTQRSIRLLTQPLCLPLVSCCGLQVLSMAVEYSLLSPQSSQHTSLNFELSTMHNFLFTIHYSLFTIHYSLFNSLFTIHYSLFTIHYSLFTVHCSLLRCVNRIISESREVLPLYDILRIACRAGLGVEIYHVGIYWYLATSKLAKCL